MSTPSSAVPSTPLEPAQPRLSEPARLINTFVSPSKTFIDIRQNASWWAPFLVVTFVSVLFAVIAVQKLDMEQLVRQGIERSPSAQRRFEQFTPEQRQRGIELQAKITKGIFYAYPVIFGIGGMVIAAVLLALFNFGFAAEIPFKQMTAIVFYGALPGIISALLLAVSILVSSDPSNIDLASGNPIPTSPAFFMDSMGNKFLYAIASSIDLIRIWQICLLGLGVSLVSTRRKLTASKAITAVFVVYGVIVLVRAGFALVF